MDDALKDAQGDEDVLIAYGGTVMPTAGASTATQGRPASAHQRTHSPSGRLPSGV